MRAVSNVVELFSIVEADRSVSKRRPPTPTDKPDSQCDDWFVRAARTLLPSNAGLVLHIITGLDERTCYRYASGDSKPSEHFLRKLFHSEQGEPFLRAFMDGCAARWWRDQQQLQRKASRWDRVVSMAAERD